MPFIAPENESAASQGFVAPENQTQTGSTAEPAPEGFWGTAGRELASEIVPAFGAAAGGLASGALALETGPGALAADVVGGAAAGAATEAAQRKAMGAEWSDQNIRQMEANARAHPHAAMLGSALPFIVSAFGGGAGYAKGAAKGLEGQLAQDAVKKAGEGATASAAGFGRAGAASESEKQVDTGQFKPGQLAEEAGKGALTGGVMHFIPGNLPKWMGAPEEGSKVLADVAKNALWRVTGKAVGDATAMVVANKAADTLIHGKPFSVADIAGDSAAGAVDFALLNAIHAGFELHRASNESKAAGMDQTAEALQKGLAANPVVGQGNVPRRTLEEPEDATKAPPPTPETVKEDATTDEVEPPLPAETPSAVPVPQTPASTDEPHIVAATYTAPDGTIQEGSNHIEAAKGFQAPQEPEQRETPEYGFKIQRPDGTTEIVDRSNALEIAKRNGQLKDDAAPERGMLHSDQITMGDEARWGDIPVNNSTRPAFESEKEARDAYASNDLLNGAVKDVGKPENFREYLQRMRCRGFQV